MSGLHRALLYRFHVRQLGRRNSESLIIAAHLHQPSFPNACRLYLLPSLLGTISVTQLTRVVLLEKQKDVVVHRKLYSVFCTFVG